MLIQAQSLEGRKFYVHAWGMTMTSRHAYEPELMQVVEDKGDTCIIAKVKNGKPSESFRKEWSRKLTEDSIKDYPAFKHINGYELTL
jgi:hypothetical protein